MRFHSFAISALLAVTASALVIPAPAVYNRGLIADVEGAIHELASTLGPVLTEELSAVIHLVPVDDVATLLTSGAANIEKVVKDLLANAGNLRRGLVMEDIPTLLHTLATEKSLKRGLIGDLASTLESLAKELPAELFQELIALKNLIPVADFEALLASGAENIIKTLTDLAANAQNLRKRGLIGDLAGALVALAKELPADVYQELIALKNLIPVADFEALLASGAENIIKTVGDLLKNAQNLRKRGLVGDLVSELAALAKELPADVYQELVAVANLIPVKDFEALVASGAENIIKTIGDLIKNAGQLRKRGIISDVVALIGKLAHELPGEVISELNALAHLIPVADFEAFLETGAENIIKTIKDVLANAQNLRKRGLIGGLVGALAALAKELPADIYSELIALKNLIPVADFEALLASGAENIIKTVGDLLKNAEQL